MPLGLILLGVLMLGLILCHPIFALTLLALGPGQVPLPPRSS